jgi:hypothetical protein
MDERQDMGIIENRRRIVEELLAKPTFKESLRLFLKNIDPDSGPELVRTLLGKDVEVPLAVVSTLPVLANLFIRTARELVVQVRSKYPTPLLASMVESLLQDVDRQTLAGLIEEIRGLGTDLSPALNAFAKAVEAQGKEIS